MPAFRGSSTPGYFLRPLRGRKRLFPRRREVVGDLLRGQRPVVDRGFVEAAFEAEGLVVAAAEEQLAAARRERDRGLAVDLPLAVEVDRDLRAVAHQGDVVPLSQLQRRRARERLILGV